MAEITRDYSRAAKRRINEVDSDSGQVGIPRGAGRRIGRAHNSNNSKKQRIPPKLSRAGMSLSPLQVQLRQFPAPAYAYSLQMHTEPAVRLAQQAGGAGGAAWSDCSVPGSNAGSVQNVDTLPLDVDTEVDTDTEDEDESAHLQRCPSAMNAEERPTRAPGGCGLVRTRTFEQLCMLSATG